MKIQVRFFGGLKQYGDTLTLDFNQPVSVSQLQQTVIDTLGEASQGAVCDAAMAVDDELVPTAYVIKNACTVDLLPPVCGG